MKVYRLSRFILLLGFGFFGHSLMMSYGYSQVGVPQMPSELNPFGGAGTRSFSPETFSSVSTQFPALALTFDDGPHPEHTPRLLDILRQYGVRATFFVVGSNVEKYPHIAQRIVSEGHQIGNHTMTHPNLVKLKRKKFDDEVKEVNTIIEAYTGVRPTCIRPPYGSLDSKVEALLHNAYGLNVVLWSVDPEDWKKPGVSEVTQRLIEGAKPGAILLAHDVHGQTIEAIAPAIAHLKAQGYRFGTIDQLLSLPPSPSGQTSPSASMNLGGGVGDVVVRPPANVSGYQVPVRRALPVAN